MMFLFPWATPYIVDVNIGTAIWLRLLVRISKAELYVTVVARADHFHKARLYGSNVMTYWMAVTNSGIRLALPPRCAVRELRNKNS